jgi:hypothetical protein
MIGICFLKTSKIKRRLVYVLFLFFFTIALLEFLLRMFDPIGIAYFSEADRYFRSMISDEIFGYIHTPKYTASLQEVNVSINSHGL